MIGSKEDPIIDMIKVITINHNNVLENLLDSIGRQISENIDSPQNIKEMETAKQVIPISSSETLNGSKYGSPDINKKIRAAAKNPQIENKNVTGK